jgi:hypothetical protein
MPEDDKMHIMSWRSYGDIFVDRPVGKIKRAKDFI